MEDVVAESKREFWRGRRVLLTGHTGFKGGWLAHWLESFGARITGYALPPPTQPSFFELTGVGRRLQSVTGDIRDLSALLATMKEAEPEIVFHLAAQPLVRQSYEDPVATYAVNVVGTANVLEAVRRTPRVRAIVNVTSDKCYENREWVWGYRETDRLGGRDPYSNSKACAELVAQSFRDSFFSTMERPVALASVRAGNVIGGGDWATDRLIPDFVRANLDGRTLRVRRPGAIRPWQHVLDPLNGYLMLAQRLFGGDAKWSDAWNFGPDEREARSVQWIVERMAELWTGDVRWEKDVGPHPHEAGYLRLDISKARQQLGWLPRWDTEQALRRTGEWYRAYRDGKDLDALTRSQIEEFEGEASVSERTV